MIDEKIEILWKWFSDNERLIRECMDDESIPNRENIVEQLNELILDLGAFYWELGPGSDKRWYFTISPNGRKDLLVLSKKIIATAPELSEWEYNYCKLPKIWNRQFKIADEYMVEQLMDASNWKFVATQHEEGMVELKIEATNIKQLDSETAQSAADLVVLNEIGEETKILMISSIDIHKQLDNIQKSEKVSISLLKNYLGKFSSGLEQ